MDHTAVMEVMGHMGIMEKLVKKTTQECLENH